VSNERRERAQRAEQMRKERERADRRQRNVLTVAIVAIVVVLIGVGGYGVSKASNDNADSSALIFPASTDKRTFGFDYTASDAGGAGKTTETDPVEVVITEDFQCPVCRDFEAQSGAFLDDLVKKGEIIINYRPISFLDRASSNEFSSRAANAAMCVLNDGGVSAYKKFHDLIYANQPEENTVGPDDDALIEYAEQAGVTGIDSCVSKKAYGPWLSKAYDSAVDDGFSGTPWVRIDGKDVEAPTPATMRAAIDAAKAA